MNADQTPRLGAPRVAGALALTGLIALAAACSSGAASPSPAPSAQPSPAPSATSSPSPSAAPSAASKDIILATTTSTQDSGLLDVLVPAFQEASGYTIKTIAVGSGQAMAMGEKGDADVLLVHSPAAEKEFVEAGFGVDRRLVMHNWFLVVGPAADPAGITGTTSVGDAFTKIAADEATFVSRGDGSGTETRELKIWKAAGIEPAGEWYIQTGQGMAATLRIASEKAGYTLTDDASWLATLDDLDLEVLVEEDAALINPYHVIEVDPDAFPRVNAAGGAAFADWILSDEAQALIDEFGVGEYGQQLFVPDAGKTEADLVTP